MSSQAYTERSSEITSCPRRRAAALARLPLALLPLVWAPVASPVPDAPGAAPDTAAGGGIEVVVEGVVEAPMLLVRSVLLDLEGLGDWFPATEDWTVLRREPDSALVYGRQVLPWPVRDRDYVVRYRWRDTPEGEFALLAESVTGVGPAPREDAVRVLRLRSEWRIRAEGPARTAVRYHYAGDLGGSLPDWVARIGWQSQTGRVIDGLAEAVERVRPDGEL